MKKKLFANWGLKLIAFFIAFGLWYTVVYSTNPVGETDFTNIKVEFVNEEVLQEQNKVSEVLDNTDVVRRVTVRGQLQTLNEMKTIGATVIATADFAKMRPDNTIPIEFSVPSQFTVGEINLKDGSPYVKLQVEDLASKNVYVRPMITGEVRDGYEVSYSSTDINMITVTGATSKVERVDHAAVVQDVSGVSSDITSTGSILLFDSEDNELDTTGLQKSQFSTGINVRVMAVKEVPLVFEVYGTPAEGYQATGRVESSPESIMVAGSTSTLNALERIVVGGSGSVMDITGATGNKSVNFNLGSYVISSGVQLAQGADGSASVTIYVEPEVEKEFLVPTGNITLTNLPDNVVSAELSDEEPYTVTLGGLQENIDQVTAEALLGTVDVSLWMRGQEMEEMESGTYNIPVAFELPEGIRELVPMEAAVTVLVEEEDEEEPSSRR